MLLSSFAQTLIFLMVPFARQLEGRFDIFVNIKLITLYFQVRCALQHGQRTSVKGSRRQL